MCVYVRVCTQEVVTSMACSDKFLVRSAPAPDTVTEVRGERVVRDGVRWNDRVGRV